MQIIASPNLDIGIRKQFLDNPVAITKEKLMEGTKEALSIVASAIVSLVGANRKMVACDIIATICGVYFGLNHSNHYKITRKQLVEMLKTALRILSDDTFSNHAKRYLSLLNGFSDFFETMNGREFSDEELEEFFAAITL